MPHSPVIKELYAEARRAGSADFYRRSKRDHLVVGASSEQFRQEPISTQMPRSGVVETYISRLPNLRPKEKAIYIRNMLYRFVDIVGPDLELVPLLRTVWQRS